MNLPPLWGLKPLSMVFGYKHVAPLALVTEACIGPRAL